MCMFLSVLAPKLVFARQNYITIVLAKQGLFCRRMKKFRLSRREAENDPKGAIKTVLYPVVMNPTPVPRSGLGGSILDLARKCTASPSSRYHVWLFNFLGWFVAFVFKLWLLYFLNRN